MNQTVPPQYMRLMRLGMYCFGITAAGVGLGFLGFGVNQRLISFVGFGVCIVGLLGGFGVVLYGWIRYGALILKGTFSKRD
jgi:hypothetical protein